MSEKKKQEEIIIEEEKKDDTTISEDDTIKITHHKEQGEKKINVEYKKVVEKLKLKNLKMKLPH